MRHVVIVLAVVLASDILGAVAADVPSPPAELRVLEDMIGTWDEVMTIKPAAGTPMADKWTAVTKRSWSLGGKVIRSDGAWLPAKNEFLYLISYDPIAGVYRSWYFDSVDGMPRVSTTGTWDAKSRTITWTSTDGAGNQSVTKHRIIDKDHHDWTMVITSPDQKVLVDYSGKCTRRKE